MNPVRLIPTYIATIITVATASYPAISATAQTATGIFNTTVETILATNPELQASEARNISEIESIRAENTLENPEIEFEHLWNSGNEANRWSAGISQSFDWPGIYKDRNKLAAATQTAFDLLQQSRRQSLRLRIQQTLIDYIAAKKNFAIYQEIKNTMDSLQTKYTRAWEHGEATILDLNKLKIENARAQIQLKTAENAIVALQAEIAAIAGNGQYSTLSHFLTEINEYPAQELLSFDEYSAAIDNDPEQAYARQQETIASFNAKLARSENLPGFNLGYIHAYEDGLHFNGISIGIDLPVYSRKHRKNAVEAQSKATAHETAAALTAAQAQLQTDYSKALNLRRQMRVLGPIIENTDNLKLLRKALDGGEMNLLTYLQEITYYLTARQDYLLLLHDYALTLASLNRGREL